MTTATPTRVPTRDTHEPDRGARAVALIVVFALLCAIGAVTGLRHANAANPWPAAGQAALEITVGGGSPERSSHADAKPAPIASLAKVMTAYVVLTRHPLRAGRDGYTITVTERHVRDTEMRQATGQSVIQIRDGEKLTQRQALQALLLPSANNVAAMLAVTEAGSSRRFVAEMNRQARELGMRHTRYTDPSGYEATTVSTAADQLVLATAAMRIPAFATIVAQRSAVLPVAGRVANTDRLLGRDGFVGIKTGSMTAAGGCFMFRSVRIVDGERVVITGVVLGQPGRSLVTAGQEAARTLVRARVARLDRPPASNPGR